MPETNRHCSQTSQVPGAGNIPKRTIPDPTSRGLTRPKPLGILGGPLGHLKTICNQMQAPKTGRDRLTMFGISQVFGAALISMRTAPDPTGRGRSRPRPLGILGGPLGHLKTTFRDLRGPKNGRDKSALFANLTGTWGREHSQENDPRPHVPGSYQA